VIPAYNEESYIKDCIKSLQIQSFTPLEIIVVDDGSTDRTVAVCKALGVKVLRQSHKGPGAARNFGARVAKGNILVFADADMVFDRLYVEKLVEPIIKGEAIATCHWGEKVLNWDNPWARCQTWYFSLPDRHRQPPIPPDSEEVYRAVRKDFFIAVGGFFEKEGRGEDISIARRTNVKAMIVKEAICYHRNVGNAGELLKESLWRGRTVPEVQSQRLRRSLTALIYENPINSIIKGTVIGIRKREPYMLLYAVVYSIGFTVGVLQALISKRYTK